MEFMDSACEACEVCETCETSGDKYKSCGEPVVMKARILRGGCCELLVCDLCNGREVLVHTDKACCFCPGQCVCIEYNGAMTMSIPPQISANCVRLLGNGNCCC